MTSNHFGGPSEMSVTEQIRSYVREHLLYGDDSVPLDDAASLLDEGIVDSTGVVELVLFVESRFGVVVEGNEVTPENFDSIAQLAAYVAKKANGAAG